MVRDVWVRPQLHTVGTSDERRTRGGFTLVELLVVIAIIGILVALLLPAIQAAREAARRNQCTNNLKQLTLGALNHESTYGHFPTIGVGGRGYVGDPNFGVGRKQPGGWLYNILPFIEEQQIHDMGAGVGVTTNSGDAARKAIFAQRAVMTIKAANCPSRRSGGPYGNVDPTDKTTPVTVGFSNQNAVTANARSDYAGNIGDGEDESFPGGTSPEGTDKSGFEALTVNVAMRKFSIDATGVFTYWKFNRLKSITDGLSKTYCFGEKYIKVDSYDNGLDGGDDQSMYCGMDRDNLRWARAKHTAVITNGSTVTVGDIPPYQDSLDDHNSGFGSAHSGVFLMSMCDGSVHGISYDIDLATHGHLANRKDGEAVTIP